MSDILIFAGPFEFKARLETGLAPRTAETFKSLLPYEQKAIHVRWSGEAVWIPLGDTDLGVPLENQTCYPAPGQVLLYPGGKSETEILLAYGGVSFASRMGQLAGNHFLTVTSPLEDLVKLGELVLWEGAQTIRFALAR
ncbi:DUF3830 family protein [Hansschlegelia beijingensis]|uniref:DUF3830 family protein n=1 Tax=Hansschlegelia beijingensis TaxID=1133344 RepID=UPI00381B7CC1